MTRQLIRKTLALNPTWFQTVASACLIGLIFLCLIWELWLAPLRPGGSWLVLKTLPLLLPLLGILHGRLYTYRWSTLLVWPYFAEGVVRVQTETAPNTIMAGLEIVLSLVFFLTAAGYIRARSIRPSMIVTAPATRTSPH